MLPSHVVDPDMELANEPGRSAGVAACGHAAAAAATKLTRSPLTNDNTEGGGGVAAGPHSCKDIGACSGRSLQARTSSCSWGAIAT